MKGKWLTIFILNLFISFSFGYISARAESISIFTYTYNEDIWIMNDDGSNPRQITQTTTSERNPNISPDGSQITYAEADFFLNISTLYIMNIDGTGKIPIFTSPYSNPEAIAEPVWSPSGTQILFSDGPSNYRDLWLTSLDGTNLQRLTTDQMHNRTAYWSPDGTQIAYTRRDSLNNSYSTQIWRMDSDGTNNIKLTETGNPNNRPDWSPDGTQIIYDSGTSHDIFIMNPDGSNKTPIISNPGLDWSPKWSPDGTQIAFINDGNIWKAGADGSDLIQITFTGGIGSLDWAITAEPVPEPATMLLLGSGLVGLAGFGRRFRKR